MFIFQLIRCYINILYCIFKGCSESNSYFLVTLTNVTLFLMYYKVYPLCVPEQDTAPDENDTCIIIGWGNSATRKFDIFKNEKKYYQARPQNISQYFISICVVEFLLFIIDI